MAPRSPHRLVARVAQPADAAHHRVHVVHLEGDVVEGGELRLRVRERVVLAVAADEAHVRSAVGNLETQFLDCVALEASTSVELITACVS